MNSKRRTPGSYNISNDYGATWQEEFLISDTPYLNMYQDLKVDNQGNLHLVYYNYAANYHKNEENAELFQVFDKYQGIISHKSATFVKNVPQTCIELIF